MWELLRKVLLFRAGQTTWRSAGKLLGLGALASVVGIIGGLHTVRRHS